MRWGFLVNLPHSESGTRRELGDTRTLLVADEVAAGSRSPRSLIGRRHKVERYGTIEARKYLIEYRYGYRLVSLSHLVFWQSPLL